MPSRSSFEAFENFYLNAINRLLQSAKFVSIEYYNLMTAFSIVKKESTEAANAVDYRIRGLGDRTIPIVLVPGAELDELRFVDVAARRDYLRNQIVAISVAQPAKFDREHYIVDWAHRLEHNKKAVILPEAVDLFLRPDQGSFRLCGTLQVFSRDKKLGSSLYKAAVNVKNFRRAIIVYYPTVTRTSIIVPKIYKINVEYLISRLS